MEFLAGSAITGSERLGLLELELSGPGLRPTAIVATCERFGSGRWGGGGVGDGGWGVTVPGSSACSTSLADW
jgi:hypothetical protein